MTTGLQERKKKLQGGDLYVTTEDLLETFCKCCFV